MTRPDEAQSVQHARLKLAFLFLAPAAVVLLATLMFYSGIGIPRGTTNKGTLVQPPRPLDELQLRAVDGAPWRYEGAKRGWGMLIAGGAECDLDCRARITLMRQVRSALGQDAGRLHRYYLAIDGLPGASLATFLASEHPDMQLIQTNRSALLALLARPGDAEPISSGAVYLVDPRGFAMMVYLPAHPDRAVLDDLRFLLRNSPD